jgi:hypothetical protein
MINIFGILCLWFKCIYYLRIWKETNYLAGMVVKVVFGMKWFLMVYMMSHLAFGQGFYRLSASCGGEHTFTTKPEDFVLMQSIFFSFMLSIGEFSTSGWNHDGQVGFRNPNFNLVWIVYLLSVTLNNIVMLNLLVAIINETYAEVSEISIEVAFFERV